MSDVEIPCKPQLQSTLLRQRSWLAHCVGVLLTVALFAFNGLAHAAGRVAAGTWHSFAVDESGTLWVWGANDGGQLGTGSNEYRYAPYALGTGFKKVTAGVRNGYAIRQDGSLWAWGENQFGQLGNGTTTSSLIPVRVGDGFIDVFAGPQNALALKADGSLWAWGKNESGQLGDGTRTNTSTPKLIGNFNFSKIATGNDHTLAIKSDNTLWAWGDNTYGQLGNGKKQALLRPTQVGTGCTDIMAGGLHSACVKSNGQLWSWGWNGYGQLGNGNNVSQLSPIRVGDGYQKLAAGGVGVDTLIALKANGAAWVSGRNEQGELGIGNTKSINRLQAQDYGYVEVSSSAKHTVAVKADGSIWSWGENAYCQLGYCTGASQSRPGKVTFADAPISPVATKYQTFVDGTRDLFAWEGRYVAVLTQSSALSPQVMSKMLAALDNAFQWYWWTTGFRPEISGTWARSYNGKAVIAELPKTCIGAAACGSIGSTGIEVYNDPVYPEHRYFSAVYNNLALNNRYDAIMFYEFGRNFWNWREYDGRLNLKTNTQTGEVNRVVADGTPVYMEIFAMEAGKLLPSEDYRKNSEKMLTYYLQDKSQNWENTIGRQQPQANNPDRLGAEALYASFMLKLYDKFGGQQFLERFWREVLKRPFAKSNQDAVDNFFVSACAAAGRNLTKLFVEEWRWPISSSAQSAVRTYPTP